MDKDDAYKTLDTVNMWINNCDTKVSVILGIYGVIISLAFSLDYISKIKAIFIKFNQNHLFLRYPYFIVAIISVVLIFVGIYKLLKVIIPRIILGAKKNGDFDSIMFFGNVAKFESYKSYCKKVGLATSESVLDDILFQIYAASKICNTKFKNQKIGLVLSLSGIVTLLVILIIGYLF